MKLIADIKPRTDGTVSASVEGNKYVFRAGADGRLVADVSDADADVLLDTGNFYPADLDDSAAVDPAITALEAKVSEALGVVTTCREAFDADSSEANAAALADAEAVLDAAEDALEAAEEAAKAPKAPKAPKAKKAAKAK